nr:hypothetical protein [Tanacetum cinerariifolium]
MLHMDLYGLMQVESINKKRYILFIVDDYFHFTWVKFLRSKDEAPEIIIKILKQAQVSLNATVRYLRTDNDTMFINLTLWNYTEEVGITHSTSTIRTLEQNGVVERRNHALVEAARTMLIFSKSLLFLWAEADLGKLQPKADIRIFIGYLPSKKAYRIYNKRTRLLMETINVQFDELTQMDFEQHGSGPDLQGLSSRHISLGLVLNQATSTSKDVAFDSDTFTNPFAPLDTSLADLSSMIVHTSNMHTFQQPQINNKIWTQDNPLVTIIGNPSKPVSTRRQLATKPHDKTLYELLISRAPIISFMGPFGCPVTILNTLDHLGKFNGKADEGFLVGYSSNSKAFRVYNSITKKVEENIYVNFLENKQNVLESGLEWQFGIDSLTNLMNYQPVSAGNRTNGIAGLKIHSDVGQKGKEKVFDQEYILLPVLNTSSDVPSGNEEVETLPRDDAGKNPNVNTASDKDGTFQRTYGEWNFSTPIPVNAAGSSFSHPTALDDFCNM